MHRLGLIVACFLCVARLAAQEDEIVANLAGGRVIVLVTSDVILFGAIDHPIESQSVPPRVASIGPTHVGILFGASEWQIPAEPNPIRLDREVPDIRPAVSPSYQPSGGGDSDLEQIGVAFLEKLRPLASQLHHKIDLEPDEPLFQVVLVGYAPQGYGPEVWLIDYRIEQELRGRSSDFWQTHILRPRFTQLYPPEKHTARTFIETRYPADLRAVPLAGLIEQKDPQITRLRSSDARIGKFLDQVERGHAHKTNPQDAAAFLEAALPLLAGQEHFFLAQMGEAEGFRWIVAPADKGAKTPEDKKRPADAPTLVRKPYP